MGTEAWEEREFIRDIPIVIRSGPGGQTHTDGDPQGQRSEPVLLGRADGMCYSQLADKRRKQRNKIPPTRSLLTGPGNRGEQDSALLLLV